MRWRWLVLAAFAVAGAVLSALVGARAAVAVESFLGGVIVTVVVLEVGLFNVRWVDRWLPQMTMLAAMGSYLMTGALLAVLLAASSPRVVSANAAAAGLVGAVVIEIGALVKASWVRAQPPHTPVTLSLHDDRPTRF